MTWATSRAQRALRGPFGAQLLSSLCSTQSSLDSEKLFCGAQDLGFAWTDRAQAPPDSSIVIVAALLSQGHGTDGGTVQMDSEGGSMERREK
ncbi:hypothetical protein Ancab_009161 [Ancistrocladus abbreviatus]